MTTPLASVSGTDTKDSGDPRDPRMRTDLVGDEGQDGIWERGAGLGDVLQAAAVQVLQHDVHVPRVGTEGRLVPAFHQQEKYSSALLLGGAQITTHRDYARHGKNL